MNDLVQRIRCFGAVLWRDTRGMVLPYAAVLLVAFIALGGLSIDIGRQYSLQTQMQAAADSIAIAGARELDRRANSISRAQSAMSTLVSNGVTGLGFSGSLSYSAVFYSDLNPAMIGGGTTASSDTTAKYVAVTIASSSIPTTLSFSQTSLPAGAYAVAGFQGTAACNISPVFICNPYESSGMTDNDATAALNAALDPRDPSYNAANLRRLLRMKSDKSTPGHFGWLQPPNTSCNNTNCLNEWVSRDSKASLAQACYDQVGVHMATGNKPLDDALSDRFDLYNTNFGPSADYSPSINVRKGYIQTAGNVCKLTQGDYLSVQAAKTDGAVPLALATAKLTTDAKNNDTQIIIDRFAGIQDGMSIVVSSTGATDTPIGTVSGAPTSTTISTTKLKTGTVKSGTTLSFVWLTTGLPLDSAWTNLSTADGFLQGNGDWDCLNYWKINHSDASGNLVAATPPGCTASNPTTSRFEVYKYENQLAGNSPTAPPITDYSGSPRATSSNGENGAPLCAKSKGFTPTYDADFDQRIMYVSVINCSAQATAIGNGNSGGTVPVAGFAKFFLTQPYNSDTQGYLYGEMVGLTNTLNSTNTKVFNQVQLYR
jgi:hypothetical protein